MVGCPWGTKAHPRYPIHSGDRDDREPFWTPDAATSPTSEAESDVGWDH